MSSLVRYLRTMSVQDQGFVNDRRCLLFYEFSDIWPFQLFYKGTIATVCYNYGSAIL